MKAKSFSILFPIMALLAISGISGCSIKKPAELRLDAETKKLLPGQTFTLNLTIVPDVYSASDIVWTSDDPEIASVSSSGCVEALRRGTAKITAATSDGKASASCLVEVKVIFAGFYVDEGGLHPCYWENAVLHDLDAGENIAPMAVSPVDYVDGVVYAAGVFQEESEGYIFYYPCYWTGTTFHDLSEGKKLKGRAASICVAEGKVYVCGEYASSSDAYYRPCYWVDGVRQEFSGALPGDGYARSITVYRGSVYTAGDYYDSGATRYVPCYWEGTERHDLPGDASQSANTSSIAFVGSVLRIGGCHDDGDLSIPCYWEGTERHDLSDQGARIVDITSVGSGVNRATGLRDAPDYNRIPCCWENGERIDLGEASDLINYSQAMLGSSGAVYYGGVYEDASGNLIPCYWENATRHDLPYYGRGGIIISDSFFLYY